MNHPTSLRLDRGDIWTVTLDRPERANALSADLVEALHDVLDEAAAARPEALVLRGNDRHFAAGFDLGGLAAETDATLALRFLRIGLLLERLIAAPYRTVAVANGVAVGAGADLVLACDHRLVDPAVTLRFPGAAFGVALGTVRRAELGAGFVTGVPGALAEALAAESPPRLPHDTDAELAALARSVAVPGLRDRIAAYTAALTKESA
ncbi:enoyl-CoA hydratase/isomerase family protein [Nocardioides carbamazepini]|uniref:enoyl-CoA hydratase/isomerase family protein n=1 Tax=Nocardioides carbamazepini TaxID=2854259 RepID=UPI00214A76F6|nr:enoyl-CoA hydratase/isomerase family protein [Nocardioides carbamazepini]MCR1784941.1 enoyl-CoA hydratase/isomerase family protein [Nocardioides carbamazepini]